MKLLLDENVDYEFKHLLPGHEVLHVDDLGWKGLSNGKLLSAAEDSGFAVVVTADRRIRFQQNISSRNISLAVLEVHPKTIANLSACVPELMMSFPQMKPGQVYIFRAQGM